MRIIMITNTYTPHVGGVARSVEAFTAEYRKRGHDVMVIAPEFANLPPYEENVLRVPARFRFNGSDFSVRLPIPMQFSDTVKDFKPDVLHSHHPFMLGATAIRLAHQHAVPLVYTHHTMYEQYTHYVPGSSKPMKRFVAEIASGYANLCDQVIAPSESLAKEIQHRGVNTLIEVIPTGVFIEKFRQGSGAGFRDVLGIPQDAFVVGHVGRLAPEKNLAFMTRCVSEYLQANPHAHFLVVGGGPSLRGIQQCCEKIGVQDRLHCAGVLQGTFLVSAYKAMDVFAFTSHSETQGMVLTEAMAAGVPVVAVDAPGAREVVIDGENGRLLLEDNVESFKAALDWVAKLNQAERAKVTAAVLERAETFSMDTTAEHALNLYTRMIERGSRVGKELDSPWERAIELAKTEWDLAANTAEAAGAAFHMMPGKTGNVDG
ncbi:MAG: glycosyl transferase family 1 [Candidatus Hydrogenedentota bacterium]|nr:MAG: glycosyl transferase family 1 [Candidatus Hydrogenedentota bacterium]